MLVGSFCISVVVVKGPEGPHLLEGTIRNLILTKTGPEDPRAFVFPCQKMWGLRTGAQGVCRAPYYYEVGYIEICAGG